MTLDEYMLATLRVPGKLLEVNLGVEAEAPREPAAVSASESDSSGDSPNHSSDEDSAPELEVQAFQWFGQAKSKLVHICRLIDEKGDMTPFCRDLPFLTLPERIGQTVAAAALETVCSNCLRRMPSTLSKSIKAAVKAASTVDE